MAKGGAALVGAGASLRCAAALLLPTAVPLPLCATGWGHLVAATASQLHIFSAGSWNTPHISDLSEGVAAILVCARCFLLAQPFTGLGVFTWEGRKLSSIKAAAGLRLEALAARQLALAPDTLAVVEAPGSCRVRFFDTAQASSRSPTICHCLGLMLVGAVHCATGN